uniref:Uncharacterized protein n=1 Tax=Oryzias melastigma TaxID=30732 RepID=A0A3B3DM82_ORYME
HKCSGVRRALQHPPLLCPLSGMDVVACVGGCVPAFAVAVLLDVTGLVLLFVGIFAGVSLNGQVYGDFLVYTGAIIIFISLAFWILWYAWNVRVKEEWGEEEDEEPGKRKSSIALLASNLKFHFFVFFFNLNNCKSGK